MFLPLKFSQYIFFKAKFSLIPNLACGMWGFLFTERITAFLTCSLFSWKIGYMFCFGVLFFLISFILHTSRCDRVHHLMPEEVVSSSYCRRELQTTPFRRFTLRRGLRTDIVSKKPQRVQVFWGFFFFSMFGCLRKWPTLTLGMGESPELESPPPSGRSFPSCTSGQDRGRLGCPASLRFIQDIIALPPLGSLGGMAGTNDFFLTFQAVGL